MLFVVNHTHTPELCPSDEPKKVQMLAQHVSQESAKKFGVKVKADCAMPYEHALLLVLEAENYEAVLQFLQPFLKMGTIKITPVISCAEAFTIFF